MPKPKLPRCLCKEKLDENDSVLVKELPEPVRLWVMRTKKCRENQRLCVQCVKTSAPEWGFPLAGINDPEKYKIGACAFDNFSCTNKAERPVPLTYKNLTLDVEKIYTAFKIPIYAPAQCLCNAHRMEVRNFIRDQEESSPLPLVPPAKRARSSVPTPHIALPCWHQTCINLRGALQQLPLRCRLHCLVHSPNIFSERTTHDSDGSRR